MTAVVDIKDTEFVRSHFTAVVITQHVMHSAMSVC